MRKQLRYSLIVLLGWSFAGCAAAHNAEAREHFSRGLDYRAQRQSDLAIEEFTKAIELDPQYELAYYNRGLAYYFEGDLARSLADLDKAIEIDPNNAYWHFDRGFIYLEFGDTEKGIADLERARELGLAPDDRQRVEEVLAQLGR
jgi:tetratricopeptide (TPR) repeat protein